MKPFEMHQMKVEKLDDGSILVTQFDHTLDPEPAILFHPEQIRYLAEQLGLIPPVPAMPASMTILKRRLTSLRDRIGELAGESKSASSSEPYLPFQVLLAKVDALSVLAIDYLADLGDETPDAVVHGES